VWRQLPSRIQCHRNAQRIGQSICKPTFPLVRVPATAMAESLAASSWSRLRTKRGYRRLAADSAVDLAEIRSLARRLPDRVEPVPPREVRDLFTPVIRFPAKVVDGRCRDAMTSDVLSDPTAENGRSVGDISEVEPPTDGAVLRDEPRFEGEGSCTYPARAIRKPP
jgi:hypothetical protein